MEKWLEDRYLRGQVKEIYKVTEWKEGSVFKAKCFFNLVIFDSNFLPFKTTSGIGYNYATKKLIERKEKGHDTLFCGKQNSN